MRSDGLKFLRGAILLPVCVVCVLAACSGNGAKKKLDYAGGATEKVKPQSLEVPPDLVPPERDGTFDLPASASYSAEVARKQSSTTPFSARLLPGAERARLRQDGASRWLELDIESEKVWPKLREFLAAQGLTVVTENQVTGVIETGWAENKADLRGRFSQNALGEMLTRLHSTGFRDKYRIRLERGATGQAGPGQGTGNKTELFLTHRGLVEVVVNTTGSTEATQTTWQWRPPDTELENEMLRLLLVAFGLDEKQAALVTAAAPVLPRARLEKDPTPSSGTGAPTRLLLDEDFDRAWRRVGLSLDRMSFTVEDRDRSQGVYFVRYSDPLRVEKKPGILARWFGSEEKPREDRYRIHVAASTGERPGGVVTVQDADGKPETSETAGRILDLLLAQLR